MPFVNSNGARIHWQAQGSGTPVLLIMGHLYSSRMWYPLVPDLAKTHRVITFDNRGTGDSDTTGGVTIEQLTADALAVLEAAGESAAHVYGVSMGGGIAAEFAMAYPERTLSVTLGCTLIKQTAEGKGKGRAAWMYYMPRWLVRWAMSRGNSLEGYGSAAPVDAALRDKSIVGSERYTMKGVREQSQAISRYTTTADRARTRMTMPVLILHGDEDTAVDVKFARESHALLPHSRYVEFNGAGHNYLVACGHEATRAFVGFIDDVDAQRAAA